MATLKPSLLLYILAFLCISPFIPAQGAAQSDFFYLNLLWPGSYCNTASYKTCCMPTTGKPALDFIVESMETYDSYSESVVTNCNSTCNFYVNQLTNFITDMHSYWPSINCPRNNGVTMWNSTFCKYGPCSSLTQTNYFQRALNLRKKIDLLSLLATKGIVPSNTTKYDREDIESALRAKLSFSFVIECNRPTLRRSLKSQLLRVRICISRDGKSIISCPINKKNKCSSNKIMLPPFTYDLLDDYPIHKSNPIKMPFEIDQAI